MFNRIFFLTRKSSLINIYIVWQVRILIHSGKSAFVSAHRPLTLSLSLYKIKINANLGEYMLLAQISIYFYFVQIENQWPVICPTTHALISDNSWVKKIFLKCNIRVRMDIPIVIYNTILFIKFPFTEGAYIERFTVDFTSGNIYYTAVSDFAILGYSFSYVGVMSPEGLHAVLIENLHQPMGIAIYAADG